MWLLALSLPSSSSSPRLSTTQWHGVGRFAIIHIGLTHLPSDLYQHLYDGYRFIMQNYSEGDHICLFGTSAFLLMVILVLISLTGFSRGAYTARALAGMLYKVQ
jgi:uncharacterized protein (DUF2235 family)